MAVLKSTLEVGLRDRASAPGRRLMGLMQRLRGVSAGTQRSLNTGVLAGGVVRRLAAFGGAYIGFDQTVGAAMRFNEAMADVRKVLDPTPTEMKALRTQVLGLSKDLTGINATGLAEIMAEAGQAGVAADRLQRFTKFTAQAAVAFDLAARQAGDVFAKAGNVFQFDQRGLEHYADTVNHLSNNMAAKAPQILEFTNRAAGSAKALGLSAENLAAMGSSMIALGSVPETAGRAMTHFGSVVTKAEAGDQKIRRIFKTLGLTFEEWSKLKKENGPKAMQELFERLKSSPNGAKAIIDLFGADFSKDFSKIVDNPELLARSFRLAADEAKIAGSVQAEYLNKVDTPLKKLEKLKNNIGAIGIEIGDKIALPLGNAAAHYAELLSTMDSRLDVFDKVGRAVSGFMEGFSGKDGDPFADFKGWYRELEEMVFGKPITPDMMPWEIRDVQRMNERSLAGIADRFRGIGEAVREMAGGNVVDGLKRLSAALSELLSTGGMLGAGIGLLSLSAGLKALGLTLRLGFALWGPMKLFALAAGISAVIDSVKDVGNLGDLVDILTRLEAVDWAMIAGGIALLIGPLRTLRWLWAGGKALGRTVRTGGKGVKSAGNPPKQSKKPSIPKQQQGQWGPRPLRKSPDHRGNVNPGRVPQIKPATPPVPPLTRLGNALTKLLDSPAFLGGAAAWDLARTSGDVQHTPAWQEILGRYNEGLRKHQEQIEAAGARIGELIGKLSVSDRISGAHEEAQDATASFPELKSLLERMSTGPQEVQGGPVTTRPSGIQDVHMTNPPPRPNINLTAHFTVHEAQNADALVRETGRRLREAVAGVQADIEATPGY